MLKGMGKMLKGMGINIYKQKEIYPAIFLSGKNTRLGWLIIPNNISLNK